MRRRDSSVWDPRKTSRGPRGRAISREKAHEQARILRRQPDQVAVLVPVRELHRRPVGRPERRTLLREHVADHRQGGLRGAPLRRDGRRQGPRRRPCRQGGLGPHRASRACPHPQQDGRPDGGEPRSDRPCRDLGQRQADSRDDPRGHPAGHRPFPLLRRLRAGAGRFDLRDRPRHRRLPLPRAARRRRPDHPVELPHPHGGVEARPGACCRQLRSAEARRADPGLRAGAHGDHRRPAAAGRAERGQRLRPGGRQAPRLLAADRQDRLHR